ncbi:MAG TPA: SURF1 family protein [Gemmatimonadales bacterium]|nr:SURF1 family protein [Gemmatimonadales bacterium]
MSPTARRFAILVLLLIAALFVRLGFWQVERLQERRAATRLALAARAEPARRLGAGADWTAEELNERWVEATGVYDREHEIVLRGQAFQGTPGVHVVTPLRIAGSDSAVLVLRGFVPSADAVRADLDALDEPGTVRVRGLATPIPTGDGRPLEHQGGATWARLDLDALRARLPYPILPVLVRQTPDTALPRFPRRLPPPEPGDGPHLNYAVQWFLFAGMTVAFAVLVVGRTRGPARSG